MTGPSQPSDAVVAVFGGTFNPIHTGHLRAAEEVAEQLGLERVLFVPSAEPPHKQAPERDPLAPAAERLAWVELAIADNPRFAADPLEIERGGRSYSVETLRAVRARQGGAPPVFLIGSDAFREVDTWREPEALLSLAHFAVVTRPPASGSLADWLPAKLASEVTIARGGREGQTRSGTWIRLLEITALDVSSSDIRRRLREGRSIRYLVPDRVREAIVASGAYAASDPSGVRARA